MSNKISIDIQYDVIDDREELKESKRRERREEERERERESESVCVQNAIHKEEKDFFRRPLSRKGHADSSPSLSLSLFIFH